MEGLIVLHGAPRPSGFALWAEGVFVPHDGRDRHPRALEPKELLEALSAEGLASPVSARTETALLTLVVPAVQAQCERLLPHAQVVAQLIVEHGFGTTTAARLLNETAYYLKERARYAEAQPLFERALAIYETALGRDHRDVATSLNNLAELYRAQGRYAEAQPLYERALAVSEKALGLNHPDVATS